MCLYNSRSWRRHSEIAQHEPDSSQLSFYKHGISLGILLKIWWSIRNTFAFLDCTLLFLQVGKKIPWFFGQFHGSRGLGSGLSENQCYLGPMHNRYSIVLNYNKDHKFSLPHSPPLIIISAYISCVPKSIQTLYINPNLRVPTTLISDSM